MMRVSLSKWVKDLGKARERLRKILTFHVGIEEYGVKNLLFDPFFVFLRTHLRQVLFNNREMVTQWKMIFFSTLNQKKSAMRV